jgi:hypothetical protein
MRTLFTSNGTGELSVSQESLDVGYFSFDEAISVMTSKHFKDRVIRCLNDKELPFYIENVFAPFKLAPKRDATNKDYWMNQLYK